MAPIEPPGISKETKNGLEGKWNNKGARRISHKSDKLWLGLIVLFLIK